mgnify:CR=1 FL=1
MCSASLVYSHLSSFMPRSERGTSKVVGDTGRVEGTDGISLRTVAARQ